MELPVSFLRKQESRSHILWIPYQARNDILYSDYGDTTLGNSGFASPQYSSLAGREGRFPFPLCHEEQVVSGET